jgi:hypothetical protein
VLESLRKLRLLKRNTGTQDRVNGPRGSALMEVSVHSKRMGEGGAERFHARNEVGGLECFPFLLFCIFQRASCSCLA